MDGEANSSWDMEKLGVREALPQECGVYTCLACKQGGMHVSACRS